ncbi:MAG: hypothetical protein IE922_12155 [Sphingomonadales bacterium]|nr:hypothetical protein [Sphingomonadales bacterium]
MHKPLIAALVLTLPLAGCGFGQSRLNPFNWFDRPAAETLAPEGGYPVVEGDARDMVAQITDLTIKRTLDGAIVTATGLPPTQGFWDAELVAENKGRPVEGVITYHFLLREPPAGSPAAGRALTPASREIVAGAFINTTRLAETSKIVVIAAGNTRSISR